MMNKQSYDVLYFCYAIITAVYHYYITRNSSNFYTRILPNYLQANFSRKYLQNMTNIASLDPNQLSKRAADFSYLSQWGYRITKEIGRGGYGTVYKVVDTNCEAFVYACKINYGTISRQIIYSEVAFLELMRKKKHLPNLKNVIIESQIVHIILDYFPHRPYITFFREFSMVDVKHYVLELLLGLKNLKDMGIYHRDIKPGNFLYNPETKKGIIADFGLAQIDMEYVKKLQLKIQKAQSLLLKSNPKTKKFIELQSYIQDSKQKLNTYEKILKALHSVGNNKIGTETYMPIESLLHSHQQSYSSDIWPVGVIMLQFFTRKYSFFNQMKLPIENQLRSQYISINIIQLSILFGSQKVTKQCKRLGYQVELPNQAAKTDLNELIEINGYNQESQDLLLRLLELNSKARISVEDAIEHPFFDSVRKQHTEQKQ